VGENTQSHGFEHRAAPGAMSLTLLQLRSLSRVTGFGHGPCIREGVVGSVFDPAGWEHPKLSGQTAQIITPAEECIMKWTKPEAEVVAVTMEVTAYVATL
jgi:hypothetical protein